MKRLAFLVLLIGLGTTMLLAQSGKVTVSGVVLDK